MKGKKKEDSDYQNFEQQALKAMYEGKPVMIQKVCLVKVFNE